jgi:hypothetical protein
VIFGKRTTEKKKSNGTKAQAMALKMNEALFAEEQSL